MEDHGRMAVVRAAEKIRRDDENGRAARTVADHAAGVDDCAELLAMLGLLPEEGRR
ncbi:MAG: hypothetical protein ACRDRN_15200 [Sciscionella sp.]